MISWYYSDHIDFGAMEKCFMMVSMSAYLLYYPFNNCYNNQKRQNCWQNLKCDNDSNATKK
ncbi:MAG: hypothetical protein IJ727_04455 [Treponema sp.]|nr:hypothetical protein [Treponema sp.]